VWVQDSGVGISGVGVQGLKFGVAPVPHFFDYSQVNPQLFSLFFLPILEFSDTKVYEP